MERNIYLNLCKLYHVNGKTQVAYRNGRYYPHAYELKYDSQGNIKHTAVMIDVNSNCLVYANLVNVEEVQ